MRFLCLSALVGLALVAAAEEPVSPDAQAADPREFGSQTVINTSVPRELPVAATVDTTCCGSEHLDYGDRYYSAPMQHGFDTRKDKNLLTFNLLLTDSVEAPAPKPRQVVSEWDM